MQGIQISYAVFKWTSTDIDYNENEGMLSIWHWEVSQWFGTEPEATQHIVELTEKGETVKMDKVFHRLGQSPNL